MQIIEISLTIKVDQRMQSNLPIWTMKLDKIGCSQFRYENKCQRGYFLCQHDCINCSLDQNARNQRSGTIFEDIHSLQPIFRNLKAFTRTNIDVHIW